MRLGVVLCSVLGHRWLVDETATGVEALLRCTRCGAKEIAPQGSALDRRVATKTSHDRAVGPF